MQYEPTSSYVYVRLRTETTDVVCINVSLSILAWHRDTCIAYSDFLVCCDQ